MTFTDCQWSENAETPFIDVDPEYEEYYELSSYRISLNRLPLKVFQLKIYMPQNIIGCIFDLQDLLK